MQKWEKDIKIYTLNNQNETGITLIELMKELLVNHFKYENLISDLGICSGNFDASTYDILRIIKSVENIQKHFQEFLEIVSS